MIGDDTIATLLDNGWSLGIACRHCTRTVEAKPEWLEERFGDRRDLKLIDLLPRMSCAKPSGCGSDDVAIFPYKETPEKPKAQTSPLPELPF